MGYDVWINGEVTIPADKVEAALAAVRRMAAEEDGDEENTESFEDLIERLGHEHFEAAKQPNGDYIIGPYEDNHRNEEEAEDLFDTLAPFIPGGSFTFEGEDGEEWSWDFVKGELKYDSAAQVWGDDQNKIAAFDEILGVLYPEGKVRTKFPKGTLDKLATIIRKAGFGPFAGLSDLEALAKAAE